VLVLLVLIAFACRARSDDGTPAGAVGTPTASAQPPGAAAADDAGGTGQDTQSGMGGGGPSGDDPGGTGPGDGGENPGEGPGQDEPDENPDEDPDEPEPLGIEVSVSGPPPAPGGCTASGTISVSGGGDDDYQLTLTFRWLRLTANPIGPLPVPSQFGPDTDVVFAGPGEVTVTSPEFPEGDEPTDLLLSVTSPEQVSSEWVQYPKCGVQFAP
jgi:hypothetical protein